MAEKLSVIGNTKSSCQDNIVQEHRHQLFEEVLSKLEQDLDLEAFETIKDLEDDLAVLELSEKRRLQKWRNTLPEKERRTFAADISNIEEEISQWFLLMKDEKKHEFAKLMRKDKRRKWEKQLEEDSAIKKMDLEFQHQKQMTTLHMDYDRQLREDGRLFDMEVRKMSHQKELMIEERKAGKQKMDHEKQLIKEGRISSHQTFLHAKEVHRLNAAHNEQMAHLAIEGKQQEHQFHLTRDENKLKLAAKEMDHEKQLMIEGRESNKQKHFQAKEAYELHCKQSREQNDHLERMRALDAGEKVQLEIEERESRKQEIENLQADFAHKETMANKKIEADQQEYLQIKEATSMKLQHEIDMSTLSLEHNKQNKQLELKSAEEQHEHEEKMAKKDGILGGAWNTLTGLWSS